MPEISLSLTSKVARRALTCMAAIAVLLLTAAPLHAHHLPPGMEDVDEFEDGAAFMAGLRHPLLGMDHWMFAVIAGVLAAAVVRRGSSSSLLASLTVGTGVGGAMGVNQIILPGASAQSAMALAIAVPFLLLMLREKIPANWQLALMGLAALWQGNAHGLAWPVDAASSSYMAGMIVTTLALALSGSCVIWAARSSAVALRRSSSTTVVSL